MRKVVFHLSSFGSADQVVSAAKVHLGKVWGTARSVKQVGNEGERILILLGDTIETVVVYGWRRELTLFLMKGIGAPRETEGRRNLLARFSSTNFEEPTVLPWITSRWVQMGGMCHPRGRSCRRRDGGGNVVPLRLLNTSKLT